MSKIKIALDNKLKVFPFFDKKLIKDTIKLFNKDRVDIYLVNPAHTDVSEYLDANNGYIFTFEKHNRTWFVDADGCTVLPNEHLENGSLKNVTSDF